MSATRQSGQALIFDAIRTPRGRGKSNGALHGTKPIDLAVGLIEEIQVRNPNLDPALIDEFGRKGRSTGVGFYEYADGIQGFVSRAQLLAARYGDRFLPPQLLLDKAAAGGTFEEVN